VLDSRVLVSHNSLASISENTKDMERIFHYRLGGGDGSDRLALGKEVHAARRMQRCQTAEQSSQMWESHDIDDVDHTSIMAGSIDSTGTEVFSGSRLDYHSLLPGLLNDAQLVRRPQVNREHQHVF
jgi:hypothetical protein